MRAAASTTGPDPGSRRRKPKGDKRERTRTALLDAALALTREKGFEQTTLQDVAERAGMTTGAIYGNFKNRDELFMALAVRQWAPIRPLFRRGSSFAELMQALAEAVLASIPDRRPAAVGALTFRAYALRHETVRAAFSEELAKGLSSGATWMQAVFAAEDLPMPAEIMVRVINALIEGLLFQRFLAPELTPDEVFYAAFAALANKPASNDSQKPQAT
ncbi:TetR/AcrR family transcriptional regulator [Phenylobacterium montanum]|uniref:TetR/AcrR family transcriptional regulator n=1 Tax=Phenylobacterium montanum TaxID=2823693 RepID=A0A975IU23_9CAUL|nr:TetR/AcrR family transcriptional regulator [Caulobacter sp. S6]QUD87315.1 TetR/AcrR family transcriptional regulator [Caulobacter sp. S6]